MQIKEIIEKKKNGLPLSKQEIDFIVQGYTFDNLPDYQMAAFLMAVAINGMSSEETSDYTLSMLNTGRRIDFNDLFPRVVDKHSTGGVGDKITLPLVPLVASCGLYAPMLSGRGLGHTGGTLDKLESIPGFKTSLSLKVFETQVRKIGCAIMGQTEELAPADGKIYALRDVTGTVSSIPLIVGSILSKKASTGPYGLVLDVKFGSGAFMTTEEQAKLLSSELEKTANMLGIKTTSILSDMNQPLGIAIGNSLEVMEAIDILKGEGPTDVRELTFKLASSMLLLAEIVSDVDRSFDMLNNAIKSGKALEKFAELIECQSGNPRILEDKSILPIAPYCTSVFSPRNGIVHAIDTKKFGLIVINLGGGRNKKDDKIDYGVGLLIFKKIGDSVIQDEPIAKIYANTKSAAEQAVKELFKAYQIA